MDSFIYFCKKNKMKIFLISIITILLIFFTISATNVNYKKYYNIIKKIQNIEIREYPKLLYVSYTPQSTKDRNNSFRNVADFIFGNNESETKIDMTSPVVIKLHNKNEMAFIMPKKYTLQNLPKTNNKKLAVYEESANIKAAIKFSGYSNIEKEKKYTEKLKRILLEHNIKHKNDFELLVYNSPYQFYNRKNEITVSIDYNIMKKLDNKNLKTIHLGGGCFWCVEAIFEDAIGVVSVTSGFSAGKIKNPSYREVSQGLTEHAEVCEIIYDTKRIKLEDLLKIFFLSHDPTTLNKQGNDIGKHYRSIILYNTEKEKEIISNYMNQINDEIFENKIVTELKEFNAFYKAESYHQNYYKENSSAGYCRLVITPKVLKAKKELSKYYNQSK